ncbi:MAG: hypothetical protein FWF92_06320 [Oscillospiraceae bacterium]|nr:hypothetical protein [Oscillospiraceae bacterium]
MSKLRVISFIFILIFMFAIFSSMLISCNSQKPESPESSQTAEEINEAGTEQEQTASEPEKTFPREIRDLGGYNFRVLIDENEGNALFYEDLTIEQEEGEVYNDALYRRNLELIEKFNVKFSSVSKEDISKDVKNIVNSGSDDYDLILPRLFTAWNLIPYCNNLMQYENLSLKESWYDQNCVENLSIDNKLYIITGDAFMKHYDGIMLMIFNKQLLADLALSDPYSLVRDGKWTLDIMGEMSKGATMDIDGNGKMDRYDRWGYVLQSDILVGMINGAGLQFMYKDENDIPYSMPNTDKMNATIDKILSFYNDYSWDCLRDGKGEDKSAFWVFPEGRALFNGIMLHYIQWQLRGVEFDFGILPFPKFDESQERYYTSTNDFHTFCYMMPKSVSDPENTAYIFDAMGFYGEKIIKPAYYDVCLTRKYTRDEESNDMLDIIFKSTSYDLGIYANFGNIAGSMRTMMEKGTNTYASTYEKQESKITNEIVKFIDNIQE